LNASTPAARSLARTVLIASFVDLIKELIKFLSRRGFIRDAIALLFNASFPPFDGGKALKSKPKGRPLYAGGSNPAGLAPPLSDPAGLAAGLMPL
jgi:hypothetical protein